MPKRYIPASYHFVQLLSYNWWKLTQGFCSYHNEVFFKSPSLHSRALNIKTTNCVFPLARYLVVGLVSFWYMGTWMSTSIPWFSLIKGNGIIQWFQVPFGREYQIFPKPNPPPHTYQTEQFEEHLQNWIEYWVIGSWEIKNTMDAYSFG